MDRLMVEGPPAGLTSAQAAARLTEAGPNELPRARSRSLVKRVAAQFASPVAYLPLAAAIVAWAIGDRLDAGAIFAVLLLNAMVGLLQERSSARAVRALQSIAGTQARVVRDGRAQLIDARSVVPGDLLEIEAGDRIAADGLIVEAHTLSINEAMLTGESAPVEKHAAAGQDDAADSSRAFMGTVVSTGTARVLVRRTGASSELGRIASLLESAGETETPLRKRLAVLTRTLSLVCIAVVAVVLTLGFAHGWDRTNLFIAAVSLAVAAIPEGLPAIVTVALAVGVQRMAAHRVLVRHLDAVETLGCTTVICTDKTGTLTTGDMTVRELHGDDERRLLFAAAACCDASFDPASGSGIGDPAEVAILRAAAARGITRDAIEREKPRRDVVPFDARARFMSVTRADGVEYIKGALDTLAARSTQELTPLRQAHARMAARALRVLAVGTANAGGPVSVLGLIGIADPPREEAGRAIAEARGAGLEIVMITGDHQATAQAIARELQMVDEGADAAAVVHARARPADKLEIVRRLKERGAIVAMIGDGVNDAPALREAHVGVAMHLGGADVTKEAADLVLTDNNFVSVVAAIREGRGTFENIRKTVVFLLTGNLAELTVMAVAAAAGLPIPLLPLHLLWINLVTDALPALALVADPAQDDLMLRPPRSPDEALLRRHEWGAIARVVALEAGVTLAVFAWSRTIDANIQTARGLAFSTLVYSEVFRALASRHTRLTFFEGRPGTNLRLLLVVAASVLLQTSLIAWTPTRILFGAGDAWRWLPVAATCGLIPATVVEISKLFVRRRPEAAASPHEDHAP